MFTHSKKILVATAALVGGLWLSPPVFARDGDFYRHSYRHSYRSDYGQNWQHGKRSELRYKHNKAMNRLDRQEREAQAKAYRHYDGNRSDPRYRQRLAEIDRKYDQKRYQVDRNTRKDYRDLSRDYRRDHRNWWD